MRSFCIVVFPPLFDQDLRFFQAIEDLAIQELISEARIEALAISIFPRAARFDVQGFYLELLQPLVNATISTTGLFRLSSIFEGVNEAVEKSRK